MFFFLTSINHKKMKKIILSITLLTLLSTSIIWGQTKVKKGKKSEVMFCDIMTDKRSTTTEIVMEYSLFEDFVEKWCTSLVPVNKKLKIRYFTISASVLSKDDKGAEAFINQYQTNTGAKLSKENKEFLKMLANKKVERIVIEKIVAFNGKKEVELTGLVIKLVEIDTIKTDKGK